MLRLQNIHKSFGDTVVLQQCELTLNRGEVLALLGPSGCGKSTLLRIIAGLESPTIPDTHQEESTELAKEAQAAVVLDDEDITHWPPYRRAVNMMFQSYALFPHFNVHDNIAFGLRYGVKGEGRLSRVEQQQRVQEALALVKLQDQAQRYPHQLSGGQCQRVALARALVKRPKLLLLDEPMAALDQQLRQQTQNELRALQRALGISCILVTHDQSEAMSMADRIAIMDAGRIVQIDTPKRLYEEPNSRYVAEFMGAVNLWPVVVVKCAPDIAGTEHRYRVQVRCVYSDAQWFCFHRQALPEQQPMYLAVRPEQLQWWSGAQQENCAQVRCVATRYLGDHSVHELCYAEHLKLHMKTMQSHVKPSVAEYETTVSWLAEAGRLLPRSEHE